MKMNAIVRDLDITVTQTLYVQTLKVVLCVNARMDGMVMVSFAQVFIITYCLELCIGLNFRTFLPQYLQPPFYFTL